MQRTLIALGCALALTAGSTLAQQQPTPGKTDSATNNPSGGSMADRAKQAGQTITEKTKETASKAKDKVQETAQKAKADSDQKAAQGSSTQSMGASGSSGSSGSSSSASSQGGAQDPQQMQKKVDADYKSAKAQCDTIQQKSQKTLCEKKATAAKANAEVQVEEAKAAAEGSKSSSMGRASPRSEALAPREQSPHARRSPALLAAGCRRGLRTLAFALSGLLEAARKRLDAVGVCLVAGLAAFGGGTLRDVLLDRRPFFWVAHSEWLWVLLALCAPAPWRSCACAHFAPTERAMQWPDALGWACSAPAAPSSRWRRTCPASSPC
jgi:hypothetical protein